MYTQVDSSFQIAVVRVSGLIVSIYSYVDHGYQPIGDGQRWSIDRIDLLLFFYSACAVLYEERAAAPLVVVVVMIYDGRQTVDRRHCCYLRSAGSSSSCILDKLS